MATRTSITYEEKSKGDFHLESYKMGNFLVKYSFYPQRKISEVYKVIEEISQGFNIKLPTRQELSVLVANTLTENERPLKSKKL